MRIFTLPTKFYILFTLIALIPATLLANVLQNLVGRLSGSIPFVQVLAEMGVIEPPTSILLIGLMFWAYASYFWRVWPFRYLQDVPDIGGRYKGEVESSYDSDKKYPIVLEIHQTLLSTSVSLFTERSSSFSFIASVGRNDHGNQFLAYAYKNAPRTVSTDLDMRPHEGFANLEIFQEEEKLAGFYYNDPRERGRHGKIICKRVTRETEGRFEP